MMSLKGLLVGLFVFVSIDANAAEFLCPVPTNFQNLTCEGSVEVKSLTELIAYKNNLAQKKGRAKNVIIDFDVSTNALTISTPCKITISEKRVLNINGDLCLHGGHGVKFDESINLRAGNVRLESDQEVIVEKHADLKALNFELLSKGHTDDSKAHIRGEANVDVKNLLLEAYDRVSIGGSSTYHAQEGLKLFSRGDDDASVGAETKITAATFELQAYDRAKLGSNVNIKAETVIINSKSCSISNKTIVIDAQEKLGSCFLQSSPKGLFKADINSGVAPLAVNFSAEKISSSSFIWSFGDSEGLTTVTPSATHTFSRPGTYTVALKYLKEKKYKNAGSLQITVVGCNKSPSIS